MLTFNEDYQVSAETICDSDGYVRTLVTNNGELINGEVVYSIDSFPVLYYNLVKEFSFLNQYGTTERFVFDHDEQRRITVIKQFSEYSAQPNPSQYEQIEFTYTESNVSRVDLKSFNATSITSHDYLLFRYIEQASPFSLMKSKYYPFLCGYWFIPQSANLPTTETFYSVTNATPEENGVMCEYLYDYRQDGYTCRQILTNSFRSYALLYE